MTAWYSRPVLFVADIDRASTFYVERLGFSETWRHVDGRALVAQVERDGCELLLSCQRPDKVGGAMTFVSLDRPEFEAVKARMGGPGGAVREGWWGYPCLIVTDPDGNDLYFPDPGDVDVGPDDMSVA